MKQRRKDPSQQAIAERAGVARTTVSLVLRGGEGLKPETIKRVVKAAKELGYRPNMLVQGIRTGITRTVGVMVPPVDSYWSQVIYGLHDTLSNNDFAPLFLWNAHRGEELDDERELKQVHRLIDRRVDGVILWPTFAKMYQQHLHEFSSRNVPVVTIDYRIDDGPRTDAVLSDDRAGAKAVADHLTELGHKNIIHFSGPAVEEWSKMRLDTFEAEVDCISVEVPLWPPRLHIIRDALKTHPETTAVFAATDDIAEDVYRVAGELGMLIPDDLSVVGYGDLNYSQYLSPPLTTVHQNPYQMGCRAAALLIDRITSSKKESYVRIEYLPVELIRRKSTKAL